MSIVKCNSIEHVFWNTASTAAYSLATNVQVWRLQISSNLYLADRISALFDEEELARVAAYEQEADRQRFILCHGALRTLLGRYLECEPQDIVFSTGENKKPFVKVSGAAEVHFNIAHTGDWVLIAISGNMVGVDVEYNDGQFDYSDVISACFNYEEISYIENSEYPRSTFYMCWTRKEALIKATGRGIDNDLPAIPCIDGVYNLETNILGTGKDWEVSSFDVDDTYVGSVAYDPLKGQVRFWEAKDVLQ